MDEATNPPFLKKGCGGWVDLNKIDRLREIQNPENWIKALRKMIALTPPMIESLDEVIDPVQHRQEMKTSPYKYLSTYPANLPDVLNFMDVDRWGEIFKAHSSMFFPVKSIWDVTDAAIEKDFADLRANPPKDPIEATVRRLQYQGHLPNALKRK